MMPCMRTARWLAGFLLSLLVLALPVLAQAPTVSLVPNYQPGTHFFYLLQVHSTISTRATLDTTAEVDMQILPGSVPGRFRASMRYTRFTTTVKADASADQAALALQAAATDKAAVAMQAPEFEASGTTLQVLSRTPGPDYDQPVDVLEELVRTDSLPTGPVSVGSHWTRTRSRPVPGMNASVPLTLDCSLTGLGARDGAATASVRVEARGNAILPADALPGAAAMEAQGVVPDARVSVSSDATAIYRAADAVLLSISSESHNQLEIKLIGGAQPQSNTTESVSSATVKLERMVNP